MKGLYITHHLDIAADDRAIDFPHRMLNSIVQEFIFDLHNGSYSDFYKVYCNGYYLFIYLSNGNRVDVQL